METPNLIQIETIVACTSRCVMCGMRKLTRKAGKMPWEVFERIIDNCQQLGTIDTICPFIHGDPLCDDSILDILKYIKQKLPQATIGWFTNGLLLTEELLTEMAVIGNVKDFNISIHGGRKEIYEACMGTAWEDMIARLDLLVKVNAELGFPFNLHAHMCNFSLTTDSINEFRELMAQKNIISHVCYFSNFGGLIRDKFGECLPGSMGWLEYKLCPRSQKQLFVLWDGTVTTCCFDVNGVNRISNVKQQSLQEIWESEPYQQFRQLHREGRYKEIPVCRDCNSNRFNG